MGTLTLSILSPPGEPFLSSMTSTHRSPKVPPNLCIASEISFIIIGVLISNNWAKTSLSVTYSADSTTKLLDMETSAAEGSLSFFLYSANISITSGKLRLPNSTGFVYFNFVRSPYSLFSGSLGSTGSRGALCSGFGSRGVISGFNGGLGMG